MKGKKKQNMPKASEEKKRDKRSPNLTRKAQKCNKD